MSDTDSADREQLDHIQEAMGPGFQAEWCDYCYQNFPNSELTIVYTIINGIEQREYVCAHCEEEARENEVPPLVPDGGTTGRERFRCEDCDTPSDPPSHTKCEECGGLVREFLPMEAPVYVVDMDGYGARLWFNSDDYEGAYLHATGERTDDEGDELTAEAEEQIKIIDFDGVAEVPVTDVW